jgi:hypothetical protein
MNPGSPLVLSLLVSVCALPAAACSSSHPGAAPLPPPGDASYALPPVGDDSGDVFPDGDAPVLANMRIAHASPDAPAFDVCVAPHGTTSFHGPLVARLAVSLGAGDDAGPAGVSFSQVSAYVALAPGRYDVRLVAAGASSCDPEAALDAPIDELEASAGDSEGGSAEAGTAAPALPDFVDLPALQPSTSATLLIAGDLTPAGADAPIGVTLLSDDEELAGGAASLRAINAVPSQPALDFGLGAGAAWLPMFTDVALGQAGTTTGPGEGAADANGYVPIPTFAGQAMSAFAPSDGGGQVATASQVDVELGAIATIMAIGGKTGDATHPPGLLVCIDNQPSGGLLSDCSVGP